MDCVAMKPLYMYLGTHNACFSRVSGWNCYFKSYVKVQFYKIRQIFSHSVFVNLYCQHDCSIVDIDLHNFTDHFSIFNNSCG